MVLPWIFNQGVIPEEDNRYENRCFDQKKCQDARRVIESD